ncbi:hypothetical protein NE647_26840, partial [Blautia coccoides]|nr:hypothetical protein [Blautia coccoides]MCQ5128023.1 hypothetical protein [Blautia producta]
PLQRFFLAAPTILPCRSNAPPHAATHTQPIPGSGDERAGDAGGRGTMFQWSAVEIHLPQLLNEEANADEFS